MNPKSLVLGSASFFIFAIGVAYLLAPAFMLAVPGIAIKSINEAHLVRAAYGGAFISFGLLFGAGALKAELTHAALLSLAVFMGGFAFGRVTSMVLDGTPSVLFQAVLAGELFYTAAAAYLLTTGARRAP